MQHKTPFSGKPEMLAYFEGLPRDLQHAILKSGMEISSVEDLRDAATCLRKDP